MRAHPMSSTAARWRYMLVSGFIVLILLGIAVASYAYTDGISTKDPNPDSKVAVLVTPNADAMKCGDPENSIAGLSNVKFQDVNSYPEHIHGSDSSPNSGLCHSTGSSHRPGPNSRHQVDFNANNKCQASPNAWDNVLNLQSIEPKHVNSGEQAPKQPSARETSVPYPFTTDCIVALLIGPPNVGKSMLINSVMNYLTYQTENYSQALQKPARLPIPVFKHLITEGGYDDRPTVMFANNNEYVQYNYTMEAMSNLSKNKTGCRTCDIRHYTIEIPGTDKRLVLIDTPGIAEGCYDEKGIKKSNFGMIGRVLGERGINRIHYLWIVLPPAEWDKKSQVASALRLIKDGVFTNASRLDFVKLICTRSRTTEYRFSITLSLVRDSMRDVADKHNIALDPKFFQTNSCGVDNESILRWLFPRMVEGLTQSELHLHEAQYIQSWDASRMNMHGMIKGMLKNPIPYKLPAKWLESDAV